MTEPAVSVASMVDTPLKKQLCCYGTGPWLSSTMVLPHMNDHFPLAIHSIKFTHVCSYYSKAPGTVII